MSKRNPDEQRGYEDGLKQGERTVGQYLFSLEGSDWNKGFDEGAARHREIELEQKVRDEARKKDK